MRYLLVIQGHGEPDPGAEGDYTKESDATLDVGLKIEYLAKQVGINVTVSRRDRYWYDPSKSSTDIYDQIRLGNSRPWDMVMNIHYNAYNRVAYGVEVLYDNRLYDRNADGSVGFANFLQAQLVADTGLYSRGVKNVTGVGVLKNISNPVVLSENGFIDNPQEEIWAADEDHRWIIAEAHVKAICKYWGIPYTAKRGGNIMPDRKCRIEFMGVVKEFEGINVDNVAHLSLRQFAELFGSTADIKLGPNGEAVLVVEPEVDVELGKGTEGIIFNGKILVAASDIGDAINKKAVWKEGKVIFEDKQEGE